jgi:hypothetical protein
MKKTAKFMLLIIASICYTGLSAQTLIFSEDFETSPVTSIINNDDSALGEGEPPCGYATRGNASDYNSTNVDMNVAENSGYYAGVNPEYPCGGFYDATFKTASPLDFTDMDSLRFSFHYYKTSTLNWGGVILKVKFHNGTDSIVIDAGMTVQDSWTMYDTVLPASMLNEPSVDLSFTLGGGEAVAVDDIQVQGWVFSDNPGKQFDQNISFYPNPAKDKITIQTGYDANFCLMNALGKQVKKQTLTRGENTVNLNQIPAGIYYIRVWEHPDDIKTHKLLVR